MPYSELIKSFDRIRAYMREFYVYGFKSREEYHQKSARGYDNERRRIESWLNGLMGFRRTTEGKNVFITVDSRSVARNPLNEAFRAKSFTRNDILLHFILLDLLRDGGALTAGQIMDKMASDYGSHLDGAELPDESTVRKKLKEYAALGLLRSERMGNKQRFSESRDAIDLHPWAEAIAFYSEADSLGAIGGYLLNRIEGPPDFFRFKHHYLLRMLESEILLAALGAIRERRNIKLHSSMGGVFEATPLKILAGTQTGRYYLCAYDLRRGKLCCYRTDHIRMIQPLSKEPRFDEHIARFSEARRHIWGASIGSARGVSHIEMTVHVSEGEEYIVQRLEREKRCGSVLRVDEHHYRFSAEVYDPYELMPWIRSFIGRVTDLRCTDPGVAERFYGDVRSMFTNYGGG